MTEQRPILLLLRYLGSSLTYAIATLAFLTRAVELHRLSRLQPTQCDLSQPYRPLSLEDARRGDSSSDANALKRMSALLFEFDSYPRLRKHGFPILSSQDSHLFILPPACS